MTRHKWFSWLFVSELSSSQWNVSTRVRKKGCPLLPIISLRTESETCLLRYFYSCLLRITMIYIHILVLKTIETYTQSKIMIGKHLLFDYKDIFIQITMTLTNAHEINTMLFYNFYRSKRRWPANDVSVDQRQTATPRKSPTWTSTWPTLSPKFIRESSSTRLETSRCWILSWPSCVDSDCRRLTSKCRFSSSGLHFSILNWRTLQPRRQKESRDLKQVKKRNSLSKLWRLNRRRSETW